MNNPKTIRTQSSNISSSADEKFLDCFEDVSGKTTIAADSSSPIQHETTKHVGPNDQTHQNILTSTKDQETHKSLNADVISRIQNEFIQMKIQLNVTEQRTNEHEEKLSQAIRENQLMKQLLDQAFGRIQELESMVYSNSQTPCTSSTSLSSVSFSKTEKSSRSTNSRKNYSIKSVRVPYPSTQNGTKDRMNKPDIELGPSNRFTVGPGTTATLSTTSLKRFQSETTALSAIQETQLTHDIYSLMMIKRIFSKSWIFAMFIFTIQVCLLALIFQNQISSSVGSTIFNVPFKVTLGVRVAQFLAIFISIMISYDILMPIKDLSMLWISNDVEWSKVIVGIKSFDFTSIRDLSSKYNLDGNNNYAEEKDVHEALSRCDQTLLSCSIPMTKTNLWMLHILFPNACKFVQGVLVLIITFVIVIQSDNIIDLFKDFAAMQVIAELDNVAYYLADHGYFGSDLKEDASTVKEIKITDDVPKICRLPLRPVVLISLLGLMMSVFVGVVVVRQDKGDFFYDKYPMCKVMEVEQIATISDGICHGGLQNTFQCGFDGGDCIDFNIAFPSCKSKHAFEVGDGICQPEHNTLECGFDGGDCCQEQIPDYSLFGDEQCHPGMYNSIFCAYDNGDCESFRRKYPLCQAHIINDSGVTTDNHNASRGILGDGICDFIPEYMTEECGFEYGDCKDCQVDDYSLLGNGHCDEGLYNTEACLWDGGDCN